MVKVNKPKQKGERLYELSEDQQEELLEATKNMTLKVNPDGSAGYIGDDHKLKKLWALWSKEMGFIKKSIRPHESIEIAFWARPKRRR